MPAAVLEHIADLARRGEPDRYLAALLAPARAAPALACVAAFGAATARIPATVSDPMIGRIRLQWWRDAIEAGTATGDPVADAVMATLAAHGLDRGRLAAALEAREHDLDGDLFADDAALESWLSATEGSLFALSLAVLVPQSPGAAGEAAVRAAATAYGLARALMRLPAGLHNGGFVVPEARLAAAGVTRSRLAETPWTQETVRGLDEARRALAAHARQRLAEARTAIAALAPTARLAFLPLVMVEPYLRLQSRVRLAPDAVVPDVVPLGRLARLWLARISGRI